MRDQDHADPDLVMDPPQVLAVARACGEEHPRYEAYVLVQDLCGLRPGEANDLSRRDIALAVEEPTIKGRASHSAVPARFFTGEETPRRALKGRGPRANRKIPVPAIFVPVLRRRLDEWVDDRPDALVFTNTVSGRINRSNFGARRLVPCPRGAVRRG